MTTAYTSLLGLALPVQGELQGTWGDTVNNSITSLLDTAIAGTTTLSTDADVTLTTTTGASNQSRQAIILWTASGTVTRYITAPAQSKLYTVINKTGSTQSIVLRGVGPTTGVTIPAGASGTFAWNGVDFVDVSNYINGNKIINGNLTVNGNTTLGDASTDSLTVNAKTASNLLFTDNTYDIGASGANRPRTLYLGTSLISPAITNSGLTSGRVVYSTTNGAQTDSANLTFNGTTLTAAGLAGPLNGTVGATTPNTGAFTTGSFSGAISVTAAATSTFRNDQNTDTAVYIRNDSAGAAATARFDLYTGTALASALTLASFGPGYTGSYAGVNYANLRYISDNAAAANSNGLMLTSSFKNVYIAPAATLVGTFSSTGLAVTGTLSSTGAATLGSFIPSSSTAPNTGIYLKASGKIGIAASATDIVYVDYTGVSTGIPNVIYDLRNDNSSASGIKFGNSTASGLYGADSGLYLASIGGSQYLKGTSSVNIQVGSTIAAAATVAAFTSTGLSVTGAIDTTGNLLVGTTNSSSTAGVGLKVLPNVNYPQLSMVGSSTTNSATTLEVYSTGAAAYRFYVGYGGTIFATSTTISAISDSRYKENIVDLDVGLDAIMSLKPRKFDWKDGKGKNIKGDRGFIAQEFEQVFPDLIDEWKDSVADGEEPYKSVRQDLIPVLVKAIQELSQRLSMLENK